MSRILLSLIAGTVLSGCVTQDPEHHFVEKRGNENFYQFGVPRHAAIGGERAYNTQRNNFAANLCPQGFRIVQEKHNGAYTVIGQSMSNHFLVTIACPV